MHCPLGPRARHGQSVIHLVIPQSLSALFVAILVLILTACGVQQPRDRGSARGTSVAHDPSGSKRPAEHISRALRVNFALTRTPPDGVPAVARVSLATLPVRGISWNVAWRIPVSLPGRYWLVPGAEDLCILAEAAKPPSGGMTCGTIDNALHHAVAYTQLDLTAGRRVMVGVAPDGTRTVLIQSGLASTTVRVRHGVFVLRDSVAGPPDRLTLR